MAHWTYIRVDGRTSMNDVRQALGMLNLQSVVVGLTEDASYDAKYDK